MWCTEQPTPISYMLRNAEAYAPQEGKKKKRHSKSEERKTELLNLNTHLENKAWKLMFILGSRKMYKKMLYKKSLTESAG